MPKKDPINKEIDRILALMKTVDPTSPEYDELLKRLDVLAKAQSITKDRRISKDSIVAAVLNIGGLATILHYERFNVITSKAIGFLMKAR